MHVTPLKHTAHQPLKWKLADQKDTEFSNIAFFPVGLAFKINLWMTGN
jgi:hypothetical protein